ncbi:MAG: NapC/NirT family cytochrome c [Thauera sp.]
MFRRIWGWLRRPNTKRAAGGLIALGVVVGLLAWGAFNAAMDYTNTTAFCVSCHEMDQLVHQEYKQSMHYKNPSGVRAGCPDCHVPREWDRKLVRKLKAAVEVWHAMLGTIDTPEKFEAHRLVMAQRVWAEMAANNSRECRNCHGYEAMAFHQQTQRGGEKMEQAMQDDTPCIECHKGVAHKRPVEPRDD